MAELHEHARMQHACRGRRGGMAYGGPGMQRPNRRDRGKAEEDQQPDQRRQRPGEFRLFAQNQDIEGVQAGEFVNE